MDRAAHDASLRFRRELGAKSSCNVKNMQRRRAPCTIDIETHWMKGKVRFQSGIISCAWVTLAANRTRFRASPMAGPALGDDNALRTSVKFEEPIVSHTVTSNAHAAPCLVLEEPKLSYLTRLS
jgi:hypothetical protein